MTTPLFPSDAPFSTEQRSWITGFYAGLTTRLLQTVGAGVATGSSRPPVHVLYGSQTGNAEELALDAVETARAQGLTATAAALDEIDVADLAGLGRVLLITSTYGEGEMPDNAELFWDALSASDAPSLEGLGFTVLALGDSSYDGYCQAGRLIDTRFEQLGAERFGARVDCDVDFEDAAARWLTDALAALAAADGASGDAVDAATPSTGSTARTKSPWSRKKPYASTLAVSRRLSGAGSAKEITHFEFDLAGSGLEYEAGDALGVVPRNDPSSVDALLERLGASADLVLADSALPLAERLRSEFEIRTPSRELLADLAGRSTNDALGGALRSTDKQALDRWMWGLDTLDLLTLDADLHFDVEEFLALLKPLAHRAYSISSSPLAADGRVHLTVASVKYHQGGRLHGGVCSTHLADRLAEGDAADVFVSQNKAFRVPSDDDAPAIMVGPGTGIAPFRAFLQERRERGARGRNWLFFGDQHRAEDFIYEDELSDMSRHGVLSRLDLAFSRDQQEKVYVQTRMAENGAELYSWIEDGGHFYVCGDAGRMAKDVDDALHRIIALHGATSAEGAVEYVSRLKREKRYVRDVY